MTGGGDKDQELRERPYEAQPEFMRSAWTARISSKSWPTEMAVDQFGQRYNLDVFISTEQDTATIRQRWWQVP